MGNSHEQKLRQKDIGWIPVQSFWQWSLLAESSFPLLVCRSAVVWKPQRSAFGGFVRLLRNSFTYLELIYTIFLATPIASVLIQVCVRL